jgi:anaerobic magnesium-protoporphyrin IX monomethyl ester cyclase
MVMGLNKIVLINPHSIHAWESLGLGYIASYSYLFGFHPAQYLFFSGEFDSDEEIINECVDADVIGFSVTSFQIKHALKLVSQIRHENPKVTVVWGGYGVSGLSPQQNLELYGDMVDYFIQGPGEEAWVHVLLNHPFQRVFRYPPPGDLNIFPYPDRELIRVDRNFEKLQKLGEGRKTSMEIQRGGCPFQCIFCAASSYCKPFKRTRTAENVIGEMELLKDHYGMTTDTMVLMSDAEVFMTDQMDRMATMKMERGIDFQYGMNVVVSSILHDRQRAVLEKMVQSGLKEVWMGVESDPTLMHLTKKPINPEQVIKAFKITKEMGLVRKAYFILGFSPEENEQTICNRIPFIEQIDPEEVGFTIYIPVPGSPGYQHDLHKEIDYENSCEYYNTYTRTNTLSNDDLHYWQQYLIDHFRDKLAYRLRNNETNSLVKLKNKAGRSGH